MKILDVISKYYEEYWFNKQHLNLNILKAAILLLIVIIIANSNTTNSYILVIIGITVLSSVTALLLKTIVFSLFQKGRSLLWLSVLLVPPGWIVFFLLPNSKECRSD